MTPVLILGGLTLRQRFDMAPLSQSRSHEAATPSPLSPIEELEDDFEAEIRAKGKQGRKVAEGARSTNIARAKSTPETPSHGPLIFLPPEELSDLLLSRQHLQLVLEDQDMSEDFKTFIQTHRPESIPALSRYFNLTKALKGILYAESIIKGLEAVECHSLKGEASCVALPWVIQDQIDRTLDFPLTDDFRAFIAHYYAKMVNDALANRVVGKQDPAVPGVADGLAEVFVLSDPARPDNVIVLTSEDFQEMTGYSRKDFIGQNCRALGGPKTSLSGIRRFRASLEAEQDHCEILLN